MVCITRYRETSNFSEGHQLGSFNCGNGLQVAFGNEIVARSEVPEKRKQRRGWKEVAIGGDSNAVAGSRICWGSRVDIVIRERERERTPRPQVGNLNHIGLLLHQLPHRMQSFLLLHDY